MRYCGVLCLFCSSLLVLLLLFFYFLLSETSDCFNSEMKCVWIFHHNQTYSISRTNRLYFFFKLRRVWRYQWGNQNPYTEDEQLTQWPKEKVQKDKQRYTKHTYKTKDRVTRTRSWCHETMYNLNKNIYEKIIRLTS